MEVVPLMLASIFTFQIWLADWSLAALRVSNELNDVAASAALITPDDEIAQKR